MADPRVLSTVDDSGLRTCMGRAFGGRERFKLLSGHGRHDADSKGLANAGRMSGLIGPGSTGNGAGKSRIVAKFFDQMFDRCSVPFSRRAGVPAACA
jgi:hypothetical protein